jgi:uncharacterized membrane protein
MEAFEEVLAEVFAWVRLGIEVLGAVLIVAGVVVAVTFIIRAHRGDSQHEGQQGVRYLRLVLSQYLAVALEFLLAADILATLMEPSWTDIGELAVIAAIRTGLNYFLEREMREMEEQGERPPRRPWEFDRVADASPTETNEQPGFERGHRPA